MNRLILFQITLFILGGLGIIEYKYPKKVSLTLIIGVFFTSLLFLTTDVTVPDFKMYEEIYDYKINYAGIEKIYIELGDIFKIIGFNFFSFRILIGMITTILLYVGFNKMTSLPNLAMFYYMGYQFLEKPYIQIRNALTIAIFINVLPFLYKKQFYKSFIGIMISLLFHISGCFYFIVYFFDKISFTIKRVKIYFLFFSMGGILLYYIDFFEILRMIGNLNLGRISERVNTYFFSGAGKEHIKSSKLGIRVILNYFLFFIYTLRILSLKKKKEKSIIKEKYIFYFWGVVVLFRMLSYKIGIFIRIIGCFDFGEAMILVYLSKSISNKKNKILYFLLTYIYILFLNYKVGKDLGLW